MQMFLKKIAVIGMVVNFFCICNSFSSDGWYDHDYDHHDYDHHDYHDYDHHDHDGWWGGGHHGHSVEDMDDFGEPYDDSESSRQVVIDKYAERIKASQSRLNSELVSWGDEYSENQSHMSDMVKRFHEVAKKTKQLKTNLWSNFFDENIDNGDLVFFRPPDNSSKTGISITLLSKEQIKIVGDWTQHTALVVQYANQTNGQCLFVHLTSLEEEKTLFGYTWQSYKYVQEVAGLKRVLDELVLPSDTQDTVPYSPFMTWWIEPTQLGWERAYNAYQELLKNIGHKSCSYSARGASYISRKGLSAWLFGKGKHWKGEHNCVTYSSMILEKFGVIAETDLMKDKWSIGSFKTQLARSLIMSDSNLGVLLCRGEEDFQKEGGSKVYPWVTMNVGRIIKEFKNSNDL